MTPTFFKLLSVFVTTIAAAFGVALLVSTFRFKLSLVDYGETLALLVSNLVN